MVEIMKGFSLLELMIIVAVIAILSTLAIPTFQNYFITSKLSAARQYTDSLAQQITNYYMEHGIIPTNAQINLPAVVPTNTNEYLHAPNVAYIIVEPRTTTPGQCQYGVSTTYLSNYKGDYFSNGTSLYTILNYYYIDNRGTLTTRCSYYEYDPNTNQTTGNDIFTDCVKTTDPDSSSIMSFINTACS